MKKDTLYTVNKWNMPAFMPQGNMYWDGSELPNSLPSVPPVIIPPQNNGVLLQYLNNNSSFRNLGESRRRHPLGHDTTTVASNPISQPVVPSMAGIDNALGYFAPPTNLELPNTIENPIPQPKIKRNINTGAIKDVATTVASPVFGAINKGISGDYASNNGAAISNFSNTLGGALMAVNPLIGLGVMGVGNIVGGLVNNAEGKQQEEARKRAEEKREQQERFQLAMADINNAVNYNNDINNNAMAMSYKDGGKIHIKKANRGKFTAQAKRAGMGVQEYASHVLAHKEDYPAQTVRRANFAHVFGGRHYGYGGLMPYDDSTFFATGGPLVTGNPVQFALGGDVQTHGGDFTTGLVRLDAGGSHSENPYGGVQFGTDSQGTPNLLEEGETIYDSYVYSDRILADEATKKKFHLPLKKDISYADISKRLEREASERPSDPISKAGLEAQMADLAEQQERQKQEMEAESARRAFESLTPEEQTAVMQRVAEEEAMTQQAAAQQEQMAQAQMTQPMEQYPEGMMQQQQPMPEETMMQQAPAMGAMGGKVNRFDYGGVLKWLKKHHPDMEHMEAVAKAMQTYIDRSRIEYNEQSLPSVYASLYRSLAAPSVLSNSRLYAKKASLKNAQSRFDKLIDLDMDDETAFALSFQKPLEKYGDPHNPQHRKLRDDSKSIYDAKYKELVLHEAPKENAVSEDKLWQPMDWNSLATPQRESFVYNGTPEMPVRMDSVPPVYRSTVPGVSENFEAPLDSTSGNIPLEEEVPSPDQANVGSDQSSENPIQGNNSPAQASGTRTRDIRNINPYEYSRSWEGFNYYNPETGQYSQDYLDFANNINQDWVDRILAGNYGSMNRYLARNRGYAISPKEVARLATDRKYSDMHKAMAAAFEEYKRGIDPKTGKPTVPPTGLTDDQIDEAIRLGMGDLQTALEQGQPPVPTVPIPNNNGYDPNKDGKALEGLLTGNGTLPNKSTPSYTTPQDTDKDKGVKPVYRDENLRYMGLMGPLTALGLQAANFGRPDFTEMDNIMNRARSQVALAKWRPIGDYLIYRPFDEWSQRNRNAANLAAGLRQIGNTVNPNKQAATVAALYNGLNADGQLGIAAQAANNNQRAQVAGFNKDTNTYNANAFTQNSQFNTGILNQHNQYINNLASNIAARKMAEDKDWYGSMYANTGNVFKDLAALGKENAEWNMISDMWADGIPGVATPKTNSAKGHLGSTGGKIKRKKKGLTY